MECLQVETDPKPKRPMCAWFLYLNSVRSDLMRANPNVHPPRYLL